MNLPVGEVDDVPVGVSIMAKHGGDRFLLDTVVALYASVQEEAKIVFSNKNTLSVGSGKNEAAEAAKERVSLNIRFLFDISVRVVWFTSRFEDDLIFIILLQLDCNKITNWWCRMCYRAMRRSKNRTIPKL